MKTAPKNMLKLIALIFASANHHQCLGFIGSSSMNSRPKFRCNADLFFPRKHDSSAKLTRLGYNDSGDGGGSDEDWRDFRAKLVMKFRDDEKDGSSSGSESKSKCISTGGRWAYESGDAIEKGSIILACPEQDFGLGLRQQYFHKSLVLVIYHEELAFTKGIVLNRPTDLVLGDDAFVNADGSPLHDTKPDRHWKIWFGGEVRGLDSGDPEQCCLHSLTSDAALEVSERVLKNISWTTMSGARKLVNEGHANAEDFLVFCGYAGWSAGQLVDEINRKSWYMLQTDDKTLLEEIQKTDDAKDPQRAGLDTWKMLMEMIGKGDEVKESQGGFDDLMLKEWAKQRMVYNDGDDDVEIADKRQEEESDAAFERVERARGSIRPGTIIRAASSVDTGNEQPFLLDDQEFLQSILLIIQDDEHITVGIILNLPSAHKIDIEMGDGEKAQSEDVVTIPQRYGGKYGLKGQAVKPTVWLHNKEDLKEAKVGSPLGGDDENVWICSEKDIDVALSIDGLADIDDFMVINGFTVWEKPQEDGLIGGLMGEFLAGNFEVVAKDKTAEIWDILETQHEILTEENIEENLAAAQEAWISAGGTLNPDSEAKLDEKARNSWWCTFLLGDAKLRFS